MRMELRDSADEKGPETVRIFAAVELTFLRWTGATWTGEATWAGVSVSFGDGLSFGIQDLPGDVEVFLEERYGAERAGAERAGLHRTVPEVRETRPCADPSCARPFQPGQLYVPQRAGRGPFHLGCRAT